MSYRKMSQIAMVALVGVLLACGGDSAPLTQPDVSDLSSAIGAAKGGKGGGKPGSGAQYELVLFLDNSSTAATSVATSDLTGPEPVTILNLTNLVLPGESWLGDGNHLATCQNFLDYFRTGEGTEPGKLGAGYGHDGMYIHGDLVNFGIGDLSDAYHALALGPYDANTAIEADAPMAEIIGDWPPVGGATTIMKGTRIKFKGGKRVTKNGGCGGGWTVNDWRIEVTHIPSGN